MFAGFKILSILVGVYCLFEEMFMYKQPDGYTTDDRLIDADRKAGLSFEEIQKKRKRGAYSVKLEIEPFDLMKYRNDALAGVDPDELKRRRLAGVYGAVKPITNTYPNYKYDNCDPGKVMRENKCNVIVDVERYEHDRKDPSWAFYFRETLVPNNYITRSKII